MHSFAARQLLVRRGLFSPKCACKKILLATVISLFLGACGAPMIWSKPGATRDDFSSARYTCMQQSQQRVSAASVSALGATRQVPSSPMRICLAHA